MRYTWDGGCAFDMAAIPKAAAGQMKLANAMQLRVLVWLCCVGQGQFDAAQCAAVCGGTPEACEEALGYWVQRGLIVLEEAPCAPKVTATPVPAKPEETAAPKAATTEILLPQTVSEAITRPDRAQVIEAKTTDKQFGFLLETASAKLGKMLSPADMSVYLYLYRDLGLPPEVILMVIGYAVKNGKAKLSYIEQTAKGWAQDGINTIAAADAYLCKLEQNEQAWKQLSEAIDLGNTRPTVAAKTAAGRWLFEWHFSVETIKIAVEYTVEKLGKFGVSYTDRILERLYSEGIVTAEAAREELSGKKTTQKKPSTARMKTAKDRAPSFDINQYEELARRHRPRMPKKEG